LIALQRLEMQVKIGQQGNMEHYPYGVPHYGPIALSGAASALTPPAISLD
jgi:hypothetical protein